ncbi:branched-chain amino acid ABC transporter ATP-binding protein/permease [Marinobacter oulmenensis]|uniref:Branched-chain amino acid transport system permease protein n=1 Tax=Marinobacter oulmenensis TaxID=643747 RepID=A0A840UG46_9GAMM|nr:branched-chain amino acid ABC transporter ATP-binding protein/permease [Marinobacter oulmenensis]MBB5319767.1 branched-chain amino acid transport system permease protein [Marinobacter oulmenensis]
MKSMLNKLQGVISNAYVLIVLMLAMAVAAPFSDAGTVQMWCFAAINVLLAQSVNLLTGIAGQISLGHAGFFAIGAYTSAIAMTNWGVPLPLAVAFSSLMGTAVGYLLSIPAGRVREFYLAMMSLAFGLIVYELLREWRGVTGGVMGMRGIPSAQIGTLELFGIELGTVEYFWGLLFAVLVVMWMLRNFVKSHFGRAFYAVHVSELSAGSLGISQGATKRFAYALSGCIAGLAGGFYAFLVGYLTPESFTMMRSVEILVMTIVGGLGSLVGPVLGAVLFTYLPQKLQAFNDYQYIVYGLVLLLTFTLLPKGLAGLFNVHTRFSKRDQLKLTTDANAALTMRTPAFDPLLRVEDVVMEFSGLRALAGVSLELRRGSVMALVGPNGSGKSTLVNVISGIYAPTHGKIYFQGRNISGLPSHVIAQAGVSRTFQDPRNVPAFTVRENVLMGANRLYRHNALSAAVNAKWAKVEESRELARVEALLGAAGLSDSGDKVIGDLPYGTQRLAEVARALASDPELLLLDEPAAGLSEAEAEQLVGLIRLAQRHGVAVIVIDHHMDFLAGLVDEVVVFEAGEEIYRGDMDGMRTDPAVIEAYLGAEETENA